MYSVPVTTISNKEKNLHRYNNDTPLTIERYRNILFDVKV